MSEIRAIETRYKGFRFRSRLEARWAVCLDAIQVQWDYEPEGFDLPDGTYYLPDFWLPDLQCWVEIKGARPTGAELGRARALALMVRLPVYVFHGQCWQFEHFSIPDAKDPLGEPLELVARNWAHAFMPDEVGGEAWVMWGECPACGRHGIGAYGYKSQEASFPCGCIADEPTGFDPMGSPRLMAAFSTARSARFEYGQGGAAPSKGRGGVDVDRGRCHDCLTEVWGNEMIHRPADGAMICRQCAGKG